MNVDKVVKYAAYGLAAGWLITWWISRKEAVTPSVSFLAKTTVAGAIVGLLAGDK